MSLVKKLSANIQLRLKGKSIEILTVEIPKKWTNFMDGHDKWVEVDMKDDSFTSAMYKGKKGSGLMPHFHKNNEWFTILNPKGKVKLYTEREVKVYEYPETVFIPAGIKHACDWLEDTQIQLIWSPPFKNSKYQANASL